MDFASLVDKFGIAVAIMIVVVPTAAIFARGWIKVAEIRAGAQARALDAQSGEVEAETKTRQRMDEIALTMLQESRKQDDKIAGLYQQIASLTADNAKLTGLYEGSLSSNTKLIEHLQKSLEEALTTNRQLQDQIVILNEDKSKKDAQITRIEGDLRALRNQLTTSAQERLELDAKNTQLVSEKATLTSENAILVGQLEKKIEDEKRSMEMIQQLEARIQTLEKENERLQTRVDHLEAEAEKKKETPPAPVEPIGQALTHLEAMKV